MAATTLRVVLNRVLTAIGESKIDAAVATITDTLALKALEFLNQIKEEIEEATLWRSLRQYLTFTILANTTNAVISRTYERPRVVRVAERQIGKLVPLVFDITDPTNPVQLQERPLAELLFLLTQAGTNTTTVQPDRFAVDVSADQAVMYVYPKPNTNRSIAAYMHVPQTTLAETDLDTALKIPDLPLIKGTIWYLLIDRGEEMGASGAFTEERYRTSLDDAVSRDSAESGSLDQLVVD